MGKNLKQTASFRATPHEVYEALMDEKKHAEFLGAGAKISRKIGGKFVVYDGEVDGKNVELVPDKKIVQTWRYSDWPEGRYSTITFEFEPTSSGTKMTFTQTDIPDDKYEDIKEGWKDYYWAPLKQYFTRP